MYISLIMFMYSIVLIWYFLSMCTFNVESESTVYDNSQY